MQQFYTSGKYGEYNPTHFEEDSPYKSKMIYQIIDKNKIKPNLITDIGCGVGRIIYELSKQLSEDVYFEGYDIDPKSIALATEKWSSNNIKFYCDDFIQLNLPKADVILLIDVFEHIEDYIGFLRKLNGKANYYIFHIPLDMNIYDLLQDRQIHRRNKLGHLHYFSKSTALRTIQDTGFEIVDWFYTRTPLRKEHNGLGDTTRNVLRTLSFPWFSHLTVKLLGGFQIMLLAK